MGGWVNGAWGPRWALLSRLISTFIAVVGTSASPPRKHGQDADLCVPGAGGSGRAHPKEVTADSWTGAGWLLRERDGGAGSRQAKYCT
jgi:hypothetical protein